MPISLINLLQQWVKGIMLLSFFFTQDPKAGSIEMHCVLSATVRAGYREVERWRGRCLGFEYFRNTSLSEWGNVAKEIFKEEGGRSPC